MKFVFLAVPALMVAACAPQPPSTPAESEARRAAAFEYTANRCVQQAGGFSDSIAIQKEATARYAKARALGATEQQIAEQRQIVKNAAAGAEFWVGKDDACEDLVANVARVAS
ncbi:hypothetical protein [Pukyongiella litopenaei]|uniref:Lipoprotein n=1 Tax=Pukyongiella litopenaei TaxID=2605946 RepID=A0A2S0ML37_9RHOB|nr:hypothetical protein [Pukyongiella litopenaei]AVO36598.1 hypothetical protein C6Y53_02040 [Pukyongiella litopenaei]